MGPCVIGRRFKRYAMMMLAGVLLLPPLLVGLLFILLHVHHYWTYWERRNQADVYISQIESFKLANGYYPDPRVQTIVPEFSPYAYGSDGRQYCVGFMIYFDDDYSYCSSTQTWVDGLDEIFPWPAGSWPPGTPEAK